MLRAVLDPGVLISAALSASGSPAGLFAQWLDGAFELVVSPRLLAELSAVLKRPKFRRYLDEDEAEAYVVLLERLAILVGDPPDELGLTPDPDDDYLVALARSSGVDVLVSGDEHLLSVSEPEPRILTPAQFLNQLPGPSGGAPYSRDL